MTNKTNKLLESFEQQETNFYAKLVPSLLKEISAHRAILCGQVKEHNDTKQQLQRLYNDYNNSLKRITTLKEEVFVLKQVIGFGGLSLLVIITVMTCLLLGVL
jgi:hypothetical protein